MKCEMKSMTTFERVQISTVAALNFIHAIKRNQIQNNS